MPPITMSSREFNQDVGRAKRATRAGPVVITDRGRPAHVLLSFEEYQRLTNTKLSLGEALAEDGPADFDFNPPRLDLKLKIPDLS
jgi:prevent-host-death family protein